MSQVTVLHVSSTNKTDHLDIAEILLNVACVLHGFCRITSRKLFIKSFLGHSHMGTLGAKTSQCAPFKWCPTCHTLDTPLNSPCFKTFVNSRSYLTNT
jgi:hypothetical protein